MKTLQEVIDKISRNDYPIYFERSNGCAFVLIQDYLDDIILFDSEGFFSSKLDGFYFDDIVYVEKNYPIDNARGSFMSLSSDPENINIAYDCRKIENCITKNIVKQYVEDWFNYEDEIITTLDIKNILRENNYEVNQNEVSQYMKELYNEGFLDRTYNGKYYEYTESAGEEEEIDDNDDTNCSYSNCVCSPPNDDWVAYFDKYNYMFVDGSLTRDKARVIGGHRFGYNHDDMRACRHKNFVKKNW